jgi:hypothetical protein
LDEAAGFIGVMRLTRSGHMPGRNSAAQQSPAVPWRAILRMGTATRFRTIQVCPKDFLAPFVAG